MRGERWGRPAPCPYCHASVQTVSAPGCIATRFTVGTNMRHACLRVVWCACGEPVHPLRDGRVLDVATDRPHACREARPSAVSFRAEVPVRRDPEPHAAAPPARRLLDDLDLGDG